MATKTLVCPECASAIAPGRFACTSCGALLASVASTPRTLGWVEPLVAPEVSPAAPSNGWTEPADPDPDPAETPEVGGSIGPAWAHGPHERAPGETDLDLAVDEDAPLAADQALVSSIESVAADEPAAEAAPVAEQAAEQAPVAELSTDTEPAAELDTSAAGSPVLDPPEAPDVLPAPEAVEETPLPQPPYAEIEARAPIAAPAIPAARPQHVEPQWPETRSWPPPGAGQPPFGPEPAPRPRAGAYLPPSAVLTTVGETSEAAAPASAGSTGASTAPPVAGAGDSAASVAKQESRFLPEIDPAFPPQVVVIGAGLAALGFVLPWASIVIGSGRIGSYLDQWGLAAPGHAVILLVIIALGAAASQVDRLPRWARPGLPAVVLAGLLLGLVWPYLFAGLQPSVGVYVTLIGAAVLAVGGLVDLWRSRHDGAPRAV